MVDKKYKYYSFDDALKALQKYCAYQDRCHYEVRTKLLMLKIYGDELEEIISLLIQDKYLDEERFTRSYVRGKYKLKKWGRIKITQMLKLKHISDYCLRKGMNEIDEELYVDNLKHWLSRKSNDYKEDPVYVRKNKLVKFLFNKGFEYELINEHIQDYLQYD